MTTLALLFFDVKCMRMFTNVEVRRRMDLRYFLTLAFLYHRLFWTWDCSRTLMKVGSAAWVCLQMGVPCVQEAGIQTSRLVQIWLCKFQIFMYIYTQLVSCQTRWDEIINFKQDFIQGKWSKIQNYLYAIYHLLHLDLLPYLTC